MFIDYSKIITDDLRAYLNESKLKELKTVAKNEKRYLTNKYNPDILRKILARKAEETVYINSRHQMRNNIEKAVIASEIVFDDSKKFAEVLLNGGFDTDTLRTYVKLLDYLKARIASGDLEDTDEKYITIADNFAKKIVKHFINYNGVSSQNIIINKINAVLSFEPELLEINNKSNAR